ncbi:NAD-dependent epimerase/dehydratase family protein [Gloeocapsa sp. PCC 73106]|uniref:NAD-dependent epimerase/dehydratase family protein n=1 Tax=Gloeocapsa sp. PCC 73106 TaxID=102232 RepID=UPI0002AC8758|nr:NAD-dependent epimerase/dehydratase family protein [Gloeocapsa sp. PCC 73106]ELR98771.1 putative dehydrogenase [Gloeocapsa sp. PCC 73106]
MVKVAIVGSGYIAGFHYKALRWLSPSVELVAVCDLNLALAQAFAQSRNIPKVYNDLGKMLASEQLDVVHILTPPNIHYLNAAQILEAGVDVFIEKPFCHRLIDCQKLKEKAQENNRIIGISHNFLYAEPYEKLLADIKKGSLGKIDQIDIVWNRELNMLQSGPFGVWMLQHPTNIIFEMVPHSLAHALHLMGKPDSIKVEATDKIELPRGLEFYQHWEISGKKGPTTLNMRFSFIEAYSEYYIHVRGTNGVGVVDFEKNIYTLQENKSAQSDLDRYFNTIYTARDEFFQANSNLRDLVLGKMGLSKTGGPFEDSITRTVASFYQTRETQLDERVSADLAEAVVAFGEWIAQFAKIPEPEVKPITSLPTPTEKSTVLVTGGTGFIGKALVKQLRQEGYGVRLLTRDPKSCPPELLKLGIEVVRGDFRNPETVEPALEGIEYVYHLARHLGKQWQDYISLDVQPTLEMAKMSLKHQVKRFFYTSSIAIYDVGQKSVTITEKNYPSREILRTIPYAHAKAENESLLLEMYRKSGLPLVIFRPGVVLGSGGDPCHMGIANWSNKSVCSISGDGESLLPIVLAEDVASAMVKGIKVPNIEGEDFNLSSVPCITINEYLDELEKYGQVKLRRLFTPYWVHYSQGLAKWVIKSLGKDKSASFPSYVEARSRGFGSIFDCAKAEKMLSWHPVSDRSELIKLGIQIPAQEFYST